MASLEYDSTSNALYIRLKKGIVTESEPITDNLILDLDRKGEIIGIEILSPAPINLTKLSHPIRIITRKPTSQPKN